ncbi:MAG TPA: type III pantothenate kinase, partial [Gemmatimonadaceae bacterium]|nr:type III pantothenate kinase [Gemmatimonadaceae bacterium]
MLLVADVGNTETTLGLAEGERIVAHWRVTTEANRTPDEMHLLLHSLLQASGLGGRKFRGAAIGSVVPGVTATLAEAASRLSESAAVIVD